ncbi:MAG: UDP-glucose 4-epimerase [Crocinitomicaceae bacterium]|nr:UDP-glucose 4-epimerase [Crocinitomicaceae bacterium]|tara:strand:- start:13549 stop:14544 length:996 start_codon:yes stop_codon:yes gene_type:complete
MAISLVTGGAGFIGAHVSRELIKMGHTVIVLDDLSGGNRNYLAEGVEFIEGSILDHQLLEKIFNENEIDYVYHLAAYAAEGLSHFIKRFNYNNNLIGSVNLINESVKHKIKCFVFTSSIATYGALEPPMTEDMTPIPEDPYGIAKLAVEQELRVTKEMFDLDYVIFRPHNVYGEYQNLGDKYRNVVGIFMNQIMQGNALTVFGDGQQSRAFSYIGDVAPHIAKCVDIKESYGQIFNIGADSEFTVNELAKVVMKAMGCESELRYLEARNEVVHAYASHEKARKVFGTGSLTTLEEGVRKMADWAKTQGVTSSEKFKNIEILEKLPPVWLED